MRSIEWLCGLITLGDL